MDSYEDWLGPGDCPHVFLEILVLNAKTLRRKDAKFSIGFFAPLRLCVKNFIESQ